MKLLLLLAALAPGQPSFPPPNGRAAPTDEGLRAAADAVNREINERLLPRRKQRRDEALRRVGPNALAFCQEYGEPGVDALLNCDPDTGRKLVDLHDSGDLSKLSRPALVVSVIARHGQGAAAFVAERHADLADPPALEVFCREPEEYVHAMKDLKRQAKLRAAKDPPPQPEASPWWKDWRTLACAAAGAAIAALLLRLRRPRGQFGGP